MHNIKKYRLNFLEFRLNQLQSAKIFQENQIVALEMQMLSADEGDKLMISAELMALRYNGELIDADIKAIDGQISIIVNKKGVSHVQEERTSICHN